MLTDLGDVVLDGRRIVRSILTDISVPGGRENVSVEEWEMLHLVLSVLREQGLILASLGECCREMLVRETTENTLASAQGTLHQRRPGGVRPQLLETFLVAEMPAVDRHDLNLMKINTLGQAQAADWS